MDSLFIETLRGKQGKRMPFWFMRQAGRYLPEYRELRAKTGSFLDCCYTPDIATEITLQPLKRFDMDAAILFSDILVIPHAMGTDVRFEEGEGPRLSPVRSSEELKRLSLDKIETFLKPVFDAIGLIKTKLPKDKALIGFAGSPWTIACYLCEGRTAKDYEQAKRFAYSDPKGFSQLIDMITQATIRYLSAQIKAGVNAVQLFDSWSGSASAEHFELYVIQPTKKIVAALKKEFPEIPSIGFPRAGNYLAYAQQTGVDALSVDYALPLSYIKETLQPLTIVQGNLDPLLLASDKNKTIEQAKRILETLGDRPFVFNLGHGMVPHTPVENVAALCDFLRDPR